MKTIVAAPAIALGLALALNVLTGCSAKKNSVPVEVYSKEITDWQTTRAARISSATNWLSLAGLYWLKEGDNLFGSDSSNRVILPKSTPGVIGVLRVDHDSVRLDAKPGLGVRVDDSVRATARLKSDADTSGPSVVSIGSVNFFIIKRADRIGVRVKDTLNPPRLHFTGLRFFPVDPKWQIEAKFEPFAAPQKMPVSTVIGTVDTFLCPGEVVFQFNGAEHRLMAMTEQGSEDQLYFMFSDETSGKETYGAGRQLYSALPDAQGKVVLDFNKAINWPCDYTPFATCPIPPLRNHLKFRVEAGEMLYPGMVEH